MSRRREHPAKRFSDDEVWSAGHRVTGGQTTWAEIAREHGCNKETFRARYMRLVNPELRQIDAERAKRGTRKRREAIKAVIYAARDRPCVDCGLRLPPACMELDHVRGQKLFALSVGRVGSGKQAYRTMDEIAAEIEKCDPRCPNCHRLRHYYERME